nr:nucleic acid-binding, OB-fold protein [Tanacetum cinerariifolium]
MNDSRCFEALDRTLRDILDTPEKKHFKICTLKESIRPLQPGTSEAEKELVRKFASWLLDIGDGNIGEPDIKDSQSFPPYELELKLGVPIMLLRKVNLQDFIGCLTRVGNVQRFESVGENQIVLRKIDIEDLKFTTKYNLKPPLKISKTRYEDPNQEKARNGYPLSTLLQENPDSYKAFIADHSATAMFTFFTPNANVFTGFDCSELVKKYEMPDTRDFPTEILEIERRHHIFKFHYNPYCETGRVDFYFDDKLDKPLYITESGESSKALIGTLTLEVPNPLIPSTPTSEVPIQHIPLPSPPSIVKKATTTPSQQPTGSSMRVPSDTIATTPNTSEFVQATNKEHLDEIEKTTIERANTLKRTLFSAEPQEHKKNKAD